MQLINPSTSPNELNTTLTPHSMIHGDACFAYFNKIWGIPNNPKKCHYKAKYPILGVTQCKPKSGRQGTLNSNSKFDPVRKNRPLVDDELD